MGMTVEMTGAIVPSLPDSKRIVLHHDALVPRQRRGITTSERQTLVNGFEESIECRLGLRIVIPTDQDDPPADETFSDRSGMNGSSILEAAGEIAEVKQKIATAHHAVDLIDQSIIHLLDIAEGPTETIDRIRIAEVRVRGHEDAAAQIHDRPSGRRLKFSQPSSVTATMSSMRMPPIAAQYTPGSTVRTSPTTNSGALKSSRGGS